MPLKSREVKIVKYDSFGRGIAYIDNKIVFVNSAVPKDTCLVEITNETKKYFEADIIKVIEPSNKRIVSKCPYFEECGGCAFRNVSYDMSLNFKKEKIKYLLKDFISNDTQLEVEINEQKNNYRNKVELKIINGEVGFYRKNSHTLVPIKECLNAEAAINNFIKDIKVLNLKNGEVTVKCNYNGELILIIYTEEKLDIDINEIREKNKLVGIILNNKLFYGADHFVEIIDNYIFKESYNSFFQVNRTITSKLFKIVSENIKKNDVVVDLCCGVGTLSIIASLNAKKVYGIEIVENSIRDAILNAKINKKSNIDFIVGDAFSFIKSFKEKVDTLIIDPPRSGLKSTSSESILKLLPENIIYISCNPITLKRDLLTLKEKYLIKKIYLLDMFSYTYHIETICILKRQ